jgi:hypothetical protein
MDTATQQFITRHWATLKANAAAYADLHRRARDLWRPIATAMAALRAEYPADQAFGVALEKHEIEFSYNDRAAFIWLGENLTTDQQWTEALATSPRTSVRTFVDAIRPKRVHRVCETARPPQAAAVSQPPVKPPAQATVESDVPDPLRKLSADAEAKFTAEEIGALKRTLTADMRKAVKVSIDAEFDARVEAKVQAIFKERLALEYERLRVAEEKALAKEARFLEKLQGEPVRLTQEEFRILRSVFSTDREASPQMRTKAAQVWNANTAHIKWPKEATP